MWGNLATIDTRLDSRAVTFENITGARSAGGKEAGGRKGAPSRWLAPGEKVVLADLEGPGTLRHIWMTFPPAPPEQMRGLWLEVFYDGADVPSCSVPCLDFFGLPHGRPVEYYSLLTTAHEGRGFNAYLPMPFRERVRVELTNGISARTLLFYQIDYTLEPTFDETSGYLHVAFNRENPTTLQQDFTITAGLGGPGRFLGCNIGVRVIDAGSWYGEGEVKIYRDGDVAYPTICGTGLEDYVGTGWGMAAHHGLFAGVPLDLRPPQSDTSGPIGQQPLFVGFYRWHVPDPIIFTEDLRVTIQQIGFHYFRPDQEAEAEAYIRTNPPAGAGLMPTGGPMAVAGIFERVDDYCATAYVYCRDVQAVPRLDVTSAVVDIGRLPFEQPSPFEGMIGGLSD